MNPIVINPTNQTLNVQLQHLVEALERQRLDSAVLSQKLTEAISRLIRLEEANNQTNPKDTFQKVVALEVGLKNCFRLTWAIFTIGILGVAAQIALRLIAM